jgi:hypothetical protein
MNRTTSAVGRIGLRPLVICGALTQQLAIAGIFSRYLSTKIAYEGLTYRAASATTMAICIVIGLAPAFWMRLSIARASDGAVWLLYLLSVLPASVIVPLSPPLSEGRSILFVSMTTVSFALLSCVQWAPAVRLPTSDRLARLAWPSLVAAGAGALLLVMARFGFRLSVLSIGRVYDTRLAFRATAAGASPLFGYLIVWLQNVFGPLLFVGGLVRKSIIGVGLGLLAEAWVYQTLGNRQALVAISGCWLVWRLGRRRAERGPTALLWGSVLLSVVPTAIDNIRGSFLTGYYLVRVLMLPAVVMSDYFGYFSSHPPVLFRDGFLSVFGRSPYPKSTAFTIGLEFFKNPATSANGNMWADGFSNFGHIGLFAAPLVLAVLLWLLDSGTSGAQRGAVAGVLTLTIVSLANGGLQTILVTNGFVLIIVFLAITGGASLAPAHERWLPSLRRPLGHQARPPATGQRALGSAAPVDN